MIVDEFVGCFPGVATRIGSVSVETCFFLTSSFSTASREHMLFVVEVPVLVIVEVSLHFGIIRGRYCTTSWNLCCLLWNGDCYDSVWASQAAAEATAVTNDQQSESISPARISVLLSVDRQAWWKILVMSFSRLLIGPNKFAWRLLLLRLTFCRGCGIFRAGRAT